MDARVKHRVNRKIHGATTQGLRRNNLANTMPESILGWHVLRYSEGRGQPEPRPSEYLRACHTTGSFVRWLLATHFLPAVAHLLRRSSASSANLLDRDRRDQVAEGRRIRQARTGGEGAGKRRAGAVAQPDAVNEALHRCRRECDEGLA